MAERGEEQVGLGRADAFQQRGVVGGRELAEVRGFNADDLDAGVLGAELVGGALADSFAGAEQEDAAILGDGVRAERRHEVGTGDPLGQGARGAL